MTFSFFGFAHLVSSRGGLFQVLSPQLSLIIILLCLCFSFDVRNEELRSCTLQSLLTQVNPPSSLATVPSLRENLIGLLFVAFLKLCLLLY